MMKLSWIPTFLMAIGIGTAAFSAAEQTVEWETKKLEARFFSEGGAIGDLNHDGHVDLISGPYWYAGPDFEVRHELYEVTAYEPQGYSEVFFMFAHDLNGDGWKDVLLYGWPGKDGWWLENPKGGVGRWTKHFIMSGIDGESPAWTDLTGDGKPEIVCASKGSIGYARPGEDPTKPWEFHPVTPPSDSVQTFTHGLGVGDVDNDGKPDLLDRRGWWKNTGKLDGFWELHPIPFFPRGGAQILVHDFNEDGRPDVLSVADPHAYGLSWFENTADPDGGITWKEHEIFAKSPEAAKGGWNVSQLHAIDVVDIDGDGVKDIVTGKRWWAHPPRPDGKGDPGVDDPALLFWIKVGKEGNVVTFSPEIIHQDSGVGTQVSIGDVNGDHFVDILTASKKGTLIHVQKPKP
jgi:hypothetical protein